MSANEPSIEHYAEGTVLFSSHGREGTIETHDIALQPFEILIVERTNYGHFEFRGFIRASSDYLITNVFKL